MNQESIIKNIKVIIQKTTFEDLSHLVRPAPPSESLIVAGLLVSPNVKWLPVVLGVNSLTNMENVDARFYLCLLPLCSPWYVVTGWTQCLLEGDDNFRLEELHQL